MINFISELNIWEIRYTIDTDIIGLQENLYAIITRHGLISVRSHS